MPSRRVKANHRYRFASLVLDSEVPLPEAQRDSSPGSDCRLTISPSDLQPELIQAAAFSEDRWFKVGRTAGGFALWFGELAVFEISTDGGSIRMSARPEASPETLRHLILDLLLPKVLSLRGMVALHGSVVVVDGAAAAFLGRSGAGKSTMATAFLLRGARLISDDVVVIERRGSDTVVHPAYRGVRLWPDTAPALANVGANPRPMTHYSTKLLLGTGSGRRAVRFSGRPAILRRVYVIERRGKESSTRIFSMSPQEAFRAAFEHEHRMGTTDPASVQASFDKLAGSSALELFRGLSYPDDIEALQDVVQTIRTDLRSASNAHPADLKSSAKEVIEPAP